MTKYIQLFIAIIFSTSNLHAQSIIALGQTDQIYSTILKENRTINIYFPEDYNSTDTIKYPIIYILDGGIKEDFIHLVGIVRYYTQPWIAQFPKSIVVGIENTDRKRDFTFAVANLQFLEKEGFKKESFPQYGKSAAYIAFLESELQPYMENKYNANKDRTVIGESLAGLLASEILVEKPDLFSKYIIIAPSLWWGEQKLLHESKNPLNANIKNPLNVYLGIPNKDEDIKMYEESTKFSQILKQINNINLCFDYLQLELHATIVHQAVYNAFKKLYPKK
ncbi:alpha/beta hydrolase [Sphingobacterium faecium]|uniref:alpha/beta hydrolase n=1 Tax=Sphingobacterium faecium TaxID=34087 RepID=UPI0012929BCB|nr:alpha/beta hydrolase-fold protein [Sphingobacterium faecium]MQP27273.1 alpha/beta hydrolase [Sphingobacterium faecium]